MCWNPSSKTFTASRYLWSVEIISFSLIGLPFFCLSASLIAIWFVVTGARIPITPFIPLFAIHVLLFFLTVFDPIFQYCPCFGVHISCLSLASAHDSFPREHGVGIGVFIIIYVSASVLAHWVSWASAFLASILSTYLWQEFEEFFSPMDISALLSGLHAYKVYSIW